MSVELKELATRQKQEVQTVDQEPTQNLLEAVMREMKNPSVTPERLQAFLNIGRDLMADQARTAYNQAWEAMAPELPYVAENGLNTYTNNRYAKWDDIHRACMPILRQFGFSVSFDSRKEGDVLYCIVVIRHRAGHEERPSFPFPWRDPSKGRSAADEVSAALTKAQRHAFRKAFNILSVGEEEKLQFAFRKIRFARSKMSLRPARTRNRAPANAFTAGSRANCLPERSPTCTSHRRMR